MGFNSGFKGLTEKQMTLYAKSSSYSIGLQWACHYRITFSKWGPTSNKWPSHTVHKFYHHLTAII